ncbi:MAG: hypothetical protein R2710_06865 [Acidimicrobiales bacterium]
MPGSHLLNRPPHPDELRRGRPVRGSRRLPGGFDARLWHQTGANTTTDQYRAAALGWYTRPIYRTQENWFLSLNPSVRQFASDELLELLGYKTHGLGLVNGISPD